MKDKKKAGKGKKVGPGKLKGIPKEMGKAKGKEAC